MAGKIRRSENDIHVPYPRSSLMTQTACVPLTESDVESAARLYTEVFLADEPTSHRHALDPALFLPYARFYVHSLVGKDLSFLSRNETTKELTGFIFSFDLTDDPENEGAVMSEFISHFKEAVAMIHELEDHHLNREEIKAGSVLHIFQIGVSRQYRETGIARAMINRVLAHARERGFRQVIADCTSPDSKRVFEQCGFSEMGFSPFEAFSMNDVRFFAGLTGGISLMVKNI